MLALTIFSIAPLALYVVQSVAALGESPVQVARRARSLLSSPTTYGVATLSSVYHEDYSQEWLRGKVSSGPEYFAPCFNNGDLFMLVLPVSQNWKNVLTSPDHNATLSIESSPDPHVPDPRHHAPKDPNAWDPDRPQWRRGMPSKQRLTIFGHVNLLNDTSFSNNVKHSVEEPSLEELHTCYLDAHPDAKHWAPGSDESPHLAIWARFVVDGVYRVGGFGDESSIGFIDLDLWRREGGHQEDELTKEHDPKGPPAGEFTSKLFVDNSFLPPPDTSLLHFQNH